MKPLGQLSRGEGIVTGNHGLHPRVVMAEAVPLCNGSPVVMLIFEAKGKTGPRSFLPPK